MSLVSRFRAGLKAEIGVFFPMIVLRVLENVAQPNFQQKMIVLRFLEKLCIDSQILVDIFINYDCDVESSNIFERYFSSLLLTSCIGPFIQSNIMLRLKLDFYFAVAWYACVCVSEISFWYFVPSQIILQVLLVTVCYALQGILL
jgi:hypothetical protein